MHRCGVLIVACLALAGSFSCAAGQAGMSGQSVRASLGRGAAADQDPAAMKHGARAALVATDRTAFAPSAMELMVVGDRERATGAYDRAHKAYVRAHFADRESLVPLERIAYLALRSDPARAEKLFHELLEEAPDDSSLLVGLAYSELAQGQSSEARRVLERALRSDPDSSAAHAALAIAQDTVHEFDRASASNTRAMAGAPAKVQVLNNQGVSSLLAGRSEEAIGLLQRASRSDPDSRLAANNLGLALGLAGLDQQAYDAFRLHGSRGDALNNLGLVCFLRGDRDAARTHFEAALLSSETDELRVLRNLEILDAALARQ
jgi:Flp pilus assembly protein TadD